MKLYDHVVIFGEKVNIEYSNNVPDTDNANYVKGKILIHPGCPRKELARVFLHEFLHAVCERVSISQGITGETEEIVVDTLSKALVENFHIRFKDR